MIRSVAELLRIFSDREVEVLKTAGITHPPTIGKMYEGLTSDILSKSLPSGLNLQVVSGFVTDGDEALSGQVDCMLVSGKGDPIPYTDDFKWHVKNVIAVIEVKKNMFSKGLVESFDHLRGILDVHSKWIQAAKNGPQLRIGPSLRAFAEMTGRIAPEHSSLSDLPMPLEYVYHTILGDQFSPVRIALGYQGFGSEYGFRQALVKFMSKVIGDHGYGPHSFPQLIVSGGASLVKFNGHPYRARMVDGRMLLLASTDINPLLPMLELIWTRLNYIEPMPELFGEDLETENLAPLLWAELGEDPNQAGRFGWQYTVENISKAALTERPQFSDWEPVFLTLDQYAVIDMLCNEHVVDIEDEDFLSFVAKEGLNVDDFVNELLETSLVALKGTEIRLATEACVMAILPSGDYVAAENSTGRFDRWLAKEFSQPSKKD